MSDRRSFRIVLILHTSDKGPILVSVSTTSKILEFDAITGGDTLIYIHDIYNLHI